MNTENNKLFVKMVSIDFMVDDFLKNQSNFFKKQSRRMVNVEHNFEDALQDIKLKALEVLHHVKKKVDEGSWGSETTLEDATFYTVSCISKHVSSYCKSCIEKVDLSLKTGKTSSLNDVGEESSNPSKLELEVDGNNLSSRDVFESRLTFRQILKNLEENPDEKFRIFSKLILDPSEEFKIKYKEHMESFTKNVHKNKPFNVSFISKYMGINPSLGNSYFVQLQELLKGFWGLSTYSGSSNYSR